MAKITRKAQKVFASTAGGSGVAVAGSTADGSTIFSTDLDALQSTEYLEGLAAMVIAGTKRLPVFEEINGVYYVVTTQLAYLFQEGIPEWNAGTTYYQYSIVKKAGTYEIYGSLANDNLNNALPAATTDANWQYLGNLAGVGTIPATAANTFLANATTGSASATGIALAASQLAGRGSTGNIAAITLQPSMSISGTALGAIANPSVRKNLKVEATSATQAVITADALTLTTSTGLSYVATSVNVTAAITASGVNGLDTGSEASNTWYYVYIIYNGTLVRSLLSTSATSPTLPSGYTYFARVGAVRNDASSNFYRTLQKGNQVQYVVGANPTSILLMASGASGDILAPTYTSLAVAAFVPPTAASIKLFCIGTAVPNGVIAAPNNAYGAFASASNPPPIMNTTSSGATEINAEIMLEGANIFYAQQANNYIRCVGWTDNL
jgi:hypothetical protein